MANLWNVLVCFFNTLASISPPVVATAISLFGILNIAGLSFNYRESKRRHLSKTKLERLTRIHAWSTEGTQLGLASLCFVQVSTLLCTLLVTASLSKEEGLQKCGLLMAAESLAAIVVYISAVYGVDMVEAKILLGTWSPPDRPLLITRNWVLSLKRKITGRRDRLVKAPRTTGFRKRAYSESTQLLDQEFAMLRQSKKLDYLDLSTSNP